MASVTIREASRNDLRPITEIYNYYIINTPITFDLAPVTPESRAAWFEEHTSPPRHRLFVAEEAGKVIGFAGTGQFRDKAAYDTSVETTIYCANEARGRGVGAKLYAALFDALKDADVHRLLAGITLPNDASLKLHRRFGFADVGVFRECGRKFDRYWDVVWMERPLRLAGS